jgi:hypothetical protein
MKRTPRASAAKKTTYRSAWLPRQGLAHARQKLAPALASILLGRNVAGDLAEARVGSAQGRQEKRCMDAEPIGVGRGFEFPEQARKA